MKKRKLFVLLAAIITVSIVATLIFAFTTSVSAAPNYGSALSKSVQFFDANRCGPEAGDDQSFSWRDACHTKDGADVGLDLTGGYHDAGDHVKFGLPQGYTASVLGWGLYEFGDSMGGAKGELESVLDYFKDYFIRSHPNSNTFYYQVGEGNNDHTYWGPPEDQSEDRPTYSVANSSKAASDVLGETAAALALMYLNSGDSKALKTAKELYTMGKSNQGVGDGQSFYQSSSYGDDLAWAACWLYEATKESSYLDDAVKFVEQGNNQNQNQYEHKWAVCWDDMYLAVFYKLYDLTGNQKYADAVDYNLNYWINDLTTSPSGMKFLHNWGVLRYNASQSFLALLRYKQTANKSYKDLATKQIDYILGSNPNNMSYIIGYGSNWPKHPHHRAANGYTYANSDNTKEAKYTLTGALVGGPDQNDKYVDDVNQYQYTEVAIDYNAGLVAALAGMNKYSGGTVPNPTTPVPVETTKVPVETTKVPVETTAIPVETTEPSKSIVDYTVQNEWGNGATVQVIINNTGVSTINNWTLSFDFPGNQKINNLWCGTYKQSGSSVVVTGEEWNSSIPAKGSVFFGFNMVYSGSNDIPNNFSLK